MKQNQQMCPRRISPSGTGKAPADPLLGRCRCGWQTPSPLRCRAETEQGRAMDGHCRELPKLPTLGGTSPARGASSQSLAKLPIRWSDKTFLSFPGSLSHPVTSPCSPPLPGLCWAAARTGGTGDAEPLDAGRKQRAQEDTMGTRSLQRIEPSPTRAAPQRPGSSTGLGQGNQLCSGDLLWDQPPGKASGL